MKVRPDFAPHTAFRSWARVLYDDTHLYVGSFHFDSLGRAAIRVPDLRRDFSPPDADVFGVTFGPLGDGRTVLQLSTTPYGSQADVQAFDGGASFSFSWDAMWTVRTTRSDSGWVAEMAIPWTSLRYDPTRTSWEVNFVRGIRRVGEWSAWSPYPRQFSSWRLPYAGILDSLRPPPPRANVRSRLYGLGEWDAGDAAPTGSRGTAGGELIWAPTANALVEATVNTDFAQADVDRQVVNLTRFGVFFPEQRQFFLENADLLTAGASAFGRFGARTNPFVVQPFFSRRIGLGADGSPRPIDAGLRYGYRSARLAGGALAMRQRGVGPAGTDAATIAVVRGNRFVGHSTRIGVLAAQRVDESDAGGDDDFVTAFDLLTRWGEQTQFGGMLTTSSGSGRNAAAATWAASHSTPSIDLSLSGAYVPAAYQPRTGFVSRPNVVMTGPQVAYNWQPAWRPAQLVWIRPELSALAFHTPGSHALQEAQLFAMVEFLGRRTGRLAPFIRREVQRPTAALPLVPGVTMAAGTYGFTRVGVEAASDQSARLAASVVASAGGFFNGTQRQMNVTARWSPTPHASLRVSYEQNQLRAVGVNDTSLVTHLVAPELRLALTPRVQFSAFYQHNTVVDQGALNARFSWEFRPLSFLYVVYNSRAPTGGALGPSTESLIVKLSWLRQL